MRISFLLLNSLRAKEKEALVNEQEFVMDLKYLFMEKYLRKKSLNGYEKHSL